MSPPASRLPLCLLLLAAGACETPRRTQGPPDGEDELLVDLYSAPVRTDPEHRGLYEVDRPQSAALEETSGEEGAGREWFVAPIPSHDPQLGFGLTVLGGQIFSLDPEDEDTPPSIAALGGMYTSNDSGGVFGGFRGHLPGDRWRVLLGGGTAGVNYDFYGIGGGEDEDAVPLRTEIDFVKTAALKQLQPDLYLGPSFSFARTRSRVREGHGLPPELTPDELRLQDVAFGLQLQRDTRDDTFYPREGMLLDAQLDVYDTAWGSDLDYQLVTLPFSEYRALGEEAVLAWQVKYQQAFGDAPFYKLPSHDARGYERGRYRDEVSVGAEAEYRRHLWKRLGGAVFAGLGAVTPSLGDLDDARALPSGGLGLRIRLTEKTPLEYRIDAAWGRDGFNYYFAVGQSF